MQPPDDEELRMMRPVSEYMDDGVHADEVCRRYGLDRRELAKWCNWMDFRVTWVDPDRRPPVPSPAPDYAPTE
ncbi:hypothetical protein [Dietzia sp. UBA5065]|uniref:hypothetical protein n=1 Tax=Dietzia sp. UBA5065 TaxID=1946422 RepID=UPI0025BAD3D5|nr:hypothetical protein [Dietzia sp. UBA5065]HMT48755.1 hypothetical protein [Dietzia sp.]